MLAKRVVSLVSHRFAIARSIPRAVAGSHGSRYLSTSTSSRDSSQQHSTLGNLQHKDRTQGTTDPSLAMDDQHEVEAQKHEVEESASQVKSEHANHASAGSPHTESYEHVHKELGKEPPASTSSKSDATKERQGSASGKPDYST